VSQYYVTTPARLPVALRLASVFHFLWAGIFGFIVCCQVVLVASGTLAWHLPLWNSFVVLIYGVIGYGCLKRQRAAYNWGMASNLLNGVTHVQHLTGFFHLLPFCLMLLEFANVCLLYSARHAFPAPSVPTATGPRPSSAPALFALLVTLVSLWMVGGPLLQSLLP
jgi:hypothetical protein